MREVPLRWSLGLIAFALTAISVSRADPPAAAPAPVEPVAVAKPLLAHWAFDETAGVVSRDQGGGGYDASPEQPAAMAQRTAGVFGGGLWLVGDHKLRVSGKFPAEDLERIAFSAWVMPVDLAAYREIFRKEDGDHRLLFSFQDHGAHLSLGLDVGGYLECDASIDPSLVLDGAWHHCAATFDGQDMRVYLDGREIGSRHRPGVVRAGGRADACIASSNGGECFQGGLDDLRIYRDALTADEVATLYKNGLESMKRSATALEPRLAGLFTPGQPFANTLAECRKNFLANRLSADRRVLGPVLSQFRLFFPEECRQFAEWTGASPAEYLASPGDEFHLQRIGRLMELMLEYRPLTDEQRKRQTPESLTKWREAEAIGDRFERLKVQGEAARFSPEWINLVFEAGPRIQFRPFRSEAVAPYITPHTPPTRDLSDEEARETLERDWLHQAGGNPSPERIRQEIDWTRELAVRIASQSAGRVEFSAELVQLGQLAAKAASASQPDRELYYEVRKLKRTISFKNPRVDFDQVLFVDMPYPQGSEWPHETRHRLGYMAVPGGKLMVLQGLSPRGKLTQLMPQAPLHGSFWRPDVSYDGRKVLFCFKPHNEKSFHLYEIHADGSGLVQLTDGIYDDLDPIYLPDEEHIVFTTTRAHTYVRCMPPTNAYVLARSKRDGSEIYLISANNEPDYTPSVMLDGRLLHTRWEYTDKPLWRDQKLWTMNPDGTQVNVLWGNQSVWPDLLKDARSIPGSRRVMFTGSAHHNWFSGSVGILDPEQGVNFPDGLTKVTADVAWPECGNGPVDPIESPRYHAAGAFPAYYSPYPLSDQDFLVSANRGGKFLLYLMDVDGNRELIYEGTNHIFHAIPLKPRPRPPVIADRVAWPDRQHRQDPKQGVIFSGNVYQNAPEVLRGKARFLRVLSIEPKTYTYWNHRPYASTGPVVSVVQSEGVKRILGTVPIEADGSVSFHVPPGTPLHFQLLDENHLALQTMRSFVSTMPGEYRGCLGCHATHSRAPISASMATALARAPRDITPPPWSDDTVSYPRYVQPVLDKYCGKCHQGDPQTRKEPDLTDRPGPLDFSQPYYTLTGHPTWGQPYKPPTTPPPGFGIAGMLMVEGYGTTDPEAYKTPPPMKALSYRSHLIELASSGKHYDVKVDPISLQRLIVWIDAMCPYRGSEEIRQIDDPVFQGVEWLSVRPLIKTAPRIVRPGPVE